MIIRIYQERDRKQVLALWKECNLIRSKNDPEKDLNRKQGFGEDLFLVLENKEKIIGTVMGGYDGHRGIINYLGVDPHFRGKGFWENVDAGRGEKITRFRLPASKFTSLVRQQRSSQIL